MTKSRKLSAVVCLVFVALSAVAGCSGNGNVPGGVVQAQSSSTPAILSGWCSDLLPTMGAKNWLVGLGGLDTSPACSANGPFGVPMPSSGTLKNLRLVADPSGSLGSTATGVVTVFVNGNATPLTCTLTATVSAGPEPSCSDNVHTVNVAAGDLVAANFVWQSGLGFVFVRTALEKQ